MDEENGVNIPKSFFLKIIGGIMTTVILASMAFVATSLNDLKSAVDGLKTDIAVIKNNVDRSGDSDRAQWVEIKEIRKYLERKNGWDSDIK